MDTTKPWYLSKTVWASLVTIGLSVAGMVGLPTGSIDQGSLADTLLQLVTALSGAFAIFGRFAASKKLG
jgi:hypothetical protein